MNKKNLKINMLNDILFKEFFKSKEARGITSSFLSSLTGIDKELFMKAEFITEELSTSKITEKRKTTDIIVKIDNHKRIIIEMNQFGTKNIFIKNTSYAFNVINSTYKRKDKKIPQVILINIDNFNKFKTDKPIINFKIRDEEGHIENELYNSIHLIIENFKNTKYNIDNEINKFISLLKLTSLEEMYKLYKGDEEYMAGFVKIEDMMNDIDKVGLLYDVEENHKWEIEDARETGFDEGMEKGKEQGIEQNKKESAINFYNNGASKELICKSLNITEEKLEEYLSENK